MQRKIGLVVDSTFGLSQTFIKQHQISVVPLKILIDDKEYIDGNIDPEVVVKALQEGKHVKTSQTILENQNVYVVDSETTINGGLYLAEQMIFYLNEGHNITDALNYLEELKDRGSLIFTVDNLQTLVKNGRLGKVQAFIGNVLKIKPILRFRKGVLDLEHKVRSFKNVILYLTDEVKKMNLLGKVTVYIAFVDRSVEAKELEHELFQLGEQVNVKITGVISPVVSAHVGLGGLGIYLTNE